MFFSNTLRSLRTENSLTQQQLAKRIGVAVQTIRSWESGSKNPSMHALVSLSKIFGVPIDYMVGTSINNKCENPLSNQEESLLENYRNLDAIGRKAVEAVCRIERQRINVFTNNTPKRYLPKYTSPSAAGFSAPLGGDDFEMIPVDDTVPRNADFAIRIQGDSMEPYIMDNDTVFVVKQKTLNRGDVGVFSVNDALYCKLYYTDINKNLILVSANPDRQDSNVYVSADSDYSVICFGKVILKKPIPFPEGFRYC